MIINSGFVDKFLKKKNSKHISPYSGTVFEPICQLAPRSKGAFFESILVDFLRSKGATIKKSGCFDYTILVNGQRIVVKSSMLWEDGTFKWQQIKLDREFDAVMFLAVYPERIDVYHASRDTCKTHLDIKTDKGWIHNQHGGRKVRSGTFVLNGNPENIPWLKLMDVV